jgi:hypothetical protein
MAFSGGGSNITLPHTHDSNIVQDGGSLAANVTQFGLSAGSILYSDGSNIQELAVGSAADSLVVNGGGTAPVWSAGGGVTLTRTNKTSATQISTSSTSLVDMSFTSHTVAAGSGSCVCLFTGEFDVSAGGFIAFDFSVDGGQAETWIGKPGNETIHSSTTSITDTLGGQDVVVQYRAKTGTVIAQSDSAYNGVADYLEIS